MNNLNHLRSCRTDIASNLSTVCVLAFFLGGAFIAPASGKYDHTARLATHRSQPSECVVRHDGRSLFLGVRECFRGIPRTKMRGVWVSGLEQSIFVENALQRVKIDSRSQEGVWLDIDAADAFRRAGLSFDGTEHQFLVTFIGQKSVKTGLYGHLGQYDSGILVDKILEIQILK